MSSVCLILCGLAVGAGSQKEIENLDARFKDETVRSILDGEGWAFGHSASEAEGKRALAVIGIPENGGEFSIKAAVQRAGGLDAYRKKITGLLDSKDEFVRGFAAVWLGLLGQKESAADLVALLRSKRPFIREWSDGFDRGRAAKALGLLGAQEHAPELAAQLKSRNIHHRWGAALGLGYMKAIKFAPDLAKLIKQQDDDGGEDVATVAAVTALAQMDAKAQASEIVWIIRENKLGDPSLQPAAMYALVKLKATEYAKDIATLLKNEFRKGDAAKALALMNAQAYKKDIAELLEDENASTRCAGLIALGILRAKEYEDKVADHLKDAEEYVHWYAGWSLILMESEKHIGKIESQPDLSALSVRGQGVIQIANDEFRAVRERALESWRKLTAKRNK